MSIDRNVVLKALGRVSEPDLKKDLVTLNMIEDLQVEGQKISFSIVLTTPACPMKNRMKEDCEQEIRKDYPDAEVEVNFTANVTSGKANPSHENIKNLVAVISGKGGVGKSTVAVNLAAGLARSGAKVGLVDGDIHGPSMTLMFGLKEEKPEIIEKDGKNRIMPYEKFGVKMVSMCFFADPDKALIWRGAMITSAFRQIMDDTEWGELDYLIFDTPPGTGDIHLTLVQNYSVNGIVVVSTPQEVALADAKKAINMFTNPDINVPVLGLVENMSYFSPPEQPEKKYFIFGKEGGRELAEKMNIKLLAEIPIVEDICQSGEIGIPAVVDEANPQSEAFYAMAQNVAQAVAIRNAMQGPTKKVEITQ
ncbi:MAG: MRP family ATP-binding protein [Marinilabiliales bacterium]|nr:MAG: MRP family ATP-binding protein [Marinilabiliales bacterium]